MSTNIIVTVLAAAFYLFSSFFGGGDEQNAPNYQPSSTYQGEISSFTPRPGVVVGKAANLRNEPSLKGEVLNVLKKDQQLLVLDQTGEWYHVKTDTGQYGWLSKWLLSFTADSPGLKTGGISGYTIAGYYVENYQNDPVGYQAFRSNAAIINTVIPFLYKIDQYGNVKGNFQGKMADLTRLKGTTTLALVNNIKNGNFNSKSIHALLTNSQARSKAIAGIYRVVTTQGFKGVNIDFENVPSRDRSYVTLFFKELAAVFRPKGLLVTASLPAKTSDSPNSAHSGAFDYQALAPYLDQVYLMTYDEHYSGGSPGPVASYPWVEKVVNYAKRFFLSRKIIIGLAAYGYDWGLWSGKALNVKAITKLMASKKITSKWHATYKVPYFTYKNGLVTHKVWYENNHSIAAKMSLVKRYQLGGVAVWRLGYEDPGVWQVIANGF